MASEKTVQPETLRYSADAGNAELSALCGPLDENLRQIETILNVRVSRRGDVFRVTGELEAARRAGLELCSGGLFGMGETMADRIDLACGLRRLEIPSIPLNFLIPIPGTPLADRPPMTHDEVVRTVAVFRLVNPSACLRFAGGRQNLAPETARAALRAGINGAITGDLLTTPGSSVEEERRLVLDAGYSL